MLPGKEEIENLQEANSKIATIILRRIDERKDLENEISAVNQQYAEIGAKVDENNATAESYRKN